ncbi:MAG: FABP family protein [Bifidobacteriaceae bacterium]|nr:FABP family protein [Bifidobacteriaceae bacterium]
MTSDIPPEVYPLAGFVGRWRGSGTVGYPGIDEGVIVQEVTVAPGGGPYLAYTASTWLADADGQMGPEWHTETGYWRLPPGQTDDDGQVRASPPFDIELLVADASGFVTVYVGEVDQNRAVLASDVMARTATSGEVSAGRRLYGLVGGDLLWAWDIAAFGHELQSYMAARLSPMDKGSATSGAPGPKASE